MLKIVVSAALFAIVYCAPHPGEVYPDPAAVSHVSRLDVHDREPLVSGYEAPLNYVPLSYGSYGSYGSYAPAHHGYNYGYNYGYPVAHSYSNRIDIHSAPVVRPVYHHGYPGNYNNYNNYGSYGIYDSPGYGYNTHGYGIQAIHPYY